MSRKLQVVVPDELKPSIKPLSQGIRPSMSCDGGRSAISRPQTVDQLSRYDVERAREMGLDKLSEDEQMNYVNRVIKECCNENRSR
jgi:hypothetical protein